MSLKDFVEAFNTPYLVSVSAEAFAAGFLAQAGCDVSVQYGANQPEYDLIASKGDQFMKISVKGSQTGSWGLIQSYKKGRNYHEAIDVWAKKHSKRIIFCFVQYNRVKVGESPRLYLATVPEIAKFLKESRKGFGDTTLCELYTYTRGVAKGTTDQIPQEWKFSKARVNEMLRMITET